MTIKARARTACAPSRQATIAAALKRLTSVRPGSHRVVSCYLKVEPRDRIRGKYLIKLKNRVRTLENALPRLGLDRAVAESVTKDLGLIQQYLRSPGNLPAAHGIALFACSPVKLFEAVALPFVHRSRLVVDRTPLVRELVAAQEEFGRLYAVVADRLAARIFEVTASEATEVVSLTGVATRGGRFRADQDAPGWGEHHYHNRIREEKQRHYDAVARALFTLDRKAPAHGILVAGPGADAAALTPFLHASLQERLVASLRLNPREVTPSQVHEAALEARERFKREEELLLAEEVRQRAGEGWAVQGIDATLKALARGQVRTLLVAADASEPGYRCGSSGRLVRDDRECRAEGEGVAVVDVIDEAIEDALGQRVEVNVILEPEAALQIDGLAGLLRFR
jgi:peptide subunit release factor 1 (eRF1)